MKNFRILDGTEPQPETKSHFYDIGTFIPFLKDFSEPAQMLTVRFA